MLMFGLVVLLYVISCGAAPSVTHTNVTNGPSSGSASISLSGVNFGENDQTPTAHVMMTVCDTTSWSSTTGLVCENAGGSGVGGFLSVRVTSAVLAGTDSGLFTYDCSPIVIILQVLMMYCIDCLS